MITKLMKDRVGYQTESEENYGEYSTSTSCGDISAQADAIGYACAETMAQAIINAVKRT